MGHRVAYRIREDGNDTYAYCHWSAVISPFARLNRALEWLEKKPEMSVADILLRLCDGDKLYDPADNSDKHPYLSAEAELERYFTEQHEDRNDFEMLIEMDLDKDEISYRFDPSDYSNLMDTTVAISEGMRVFNEVLEENEDKVDDPTNIWAYNMAFTEKIITPCTITIDDLLERMKSGDVDFIRQHIRRFGDTNRWGRYSKEFDSLFTAACHMTKGDNQMLEAVTDVYRQHYYSGHSDYNAVKDAVIHSISTDDFERFKMIFDNLPEERHSDDYNDYYKQRVIVEAMKCGNDAYALYGLESGIEPNAYPWLLENAVENRCADCRDFLLSAGVILKEKENPQMAVNMLYQAAKANDGVMFAELKKQGIPINYNRSGVFFKCMYQNDPAAAAVLVEHGGDFGKFKSDFERRRFSKYHDGAEFFKVVENGGIPETTEQDEDYEFEQ